MNEELGKDDSSLDSDDLNKSIWEKIKYKLYSYVYE